MSWKTFQWTAEQTLTFIKLRSENEELFTGAKNSASEGFRHILGEMGLDCMVTCDQAKRKWENLKFKYKDIKQKSNMAGSGTEGGEETAGTWLFYAAMDEAIGGRPSVTPVNLFASGGPEGPTETNASCDMPSVAITQSPPGDNQSSAAGTQSTEAEPGPSGMQEKSKRKSPRKRKQRNEVLQFLREKEENEEKRRKEELDREERRVEQTSRQIDTLLNIFTKIVEKM